MVVQWVRGRAVGSHVYRRDRPIPLDFSDAVSCVRRRLARAAPWERDGSVKGLLRFAWLLVHVDLSRMGPSCVLHPPKHLCAAPRGHRQGARSGVGGLAAVLVLLFV